MPHLSGALRSVTVIGTYNKQAYCTTWMYFETCCLWVELVLQFSLFLSMFRYYELRCYEWYNKLSFMIAYIIEPLATRPSLGVIQVTGAFINE